MGGPQEERGLDADVLQEQWVNRAQVVQAPCSLEARLYSRRYMRSEVLQSRTNWMTLLGAHELKLWVSGFSRSKAAEEMEEQKRGGESGCSRTHRRQEGWREPACPQLARWLAGCSGGAVH